MRGRERWLLQVTATQTCMVVLDVWAHLSCERMLPVFGPLVRLGGRFLQLQRLPLLVCCLKVSLVRMLSLRCAVCSTTMRSSTTPLNSLELRKP
jgi:hypothetical protein